MTQTDHILDPIAIAHKVIGPGNPVFVIAEAGVNHNGRTDLALELVEAARQTGADCVKFQTFVAERIATVAAAKAPYQRQATGSDGGQIGMLKSLELPLEAYPAILQRCHEAGLVFLSTPYSPEDVDFLHELDVPAYKVASAQIVELSFLEQIARRGKPILLSTGMATQSEVDEAVRTIRAAGNDQIVLLQCTTNYPSPAEDANLRAIDVLRTRCGVHAGYSDHTPSPWCATAAVALGAVVIEKHLTLDKSLSGPDHAASADPPEFRRYVDAIRQVERAMGTGMKVPSPAELANLRHMRRSIVARNRIPAGTTVTADMLTFKRPATGISPARMSDVLGARARVDLKPDQILLWSDLDR